MYSKLRHTIKIDDYDRAPKKMWVQDCNYQQKQLKKDSLMTLILIMKIFANTASKSKVSIDVDRTQCAIMSHKQTYFSDSDSSKQKKQKYKHQQCYCDEGEEKKNYCTEEKEETCCNCILNISMTSEINCLGKK